MKSCECGRPVLLRFVTKELFRQLTGLTPNQLRHRIYACWTPGVEYDKIDGLVMINVEQVERVWAEKQSGSSGRKATVSRSRTRRTGKGAGLQLV